MGLTPVLHTCIHIYALIFIAVWEIMYNHYDHVNCILIFISQEPPKLYIHSHSFEQSAALCYSLTIFGIYSECDGIHQIQ
jgi:hypothetical protein